MSSPSYPYPSYGMNRCGLCGTYWSGQHACPTIYQPTVWVNPPAMRGWVCPVCGCGVSPALFVHCEKTRAVGSNPKERGGSQDER